MLIQVSSLARKSPWPVFASLLHRDIIIAYRHRGERLSPLLFFIIVVSLFAVALGDQPKTLGLAAPGVIWISALLSTLLSLDVLFRSDFDDGTLEELLIIPWPTSILVAAKICAHWLVTGFPLLLVAPLMAYALNLPTNAYAALMYTLLLGTPVLSLLGALGIALTVGLKRGGMLLAIVLLPLYMPVLILGTTAIQVAAQSQSYAGHLYVLAAMFSIAITLAPIAVAGALRISVR